MIKKQLKELQAATHTTTKAWRLTNHGTGSLNLAKTNRTCCIYSTEFLLLAHSPALIQTSPQINYSSKHWSLNNCKELFVDLLHHWRENQATGMFIFL